MLYLVIGGGSVCLTSYITCPSGTLCYSWEIVEAFFKTIYLQEINAMYTKFIRNKMPRPLSLSLSLTLMDSQISEISW